MFQQQLVQNPLKGGGAETTLVLEKCSATEIKGQEVSFGASEEKDLCWTIESTVSDRGTQGDDKYTALFKERWSSPTTSWDRNNSSSVWKTSCLMDSSSPKWAISAQDSSNGTEYLGYCGVNAQHTQLFLKKVDSNSSGGNSQLQLSLCTGSCFSESSSIGTQSSLKNWSNPTGAWASVKFWKKSAS
ncbi:hypothetical protein [Candidatus Mycoplasma haematominutum]|uniref:hypothetical protein n=1 Tax=Candidatus Mycoplasma haematominutum TaxID=209446 RepID=UPI0011B52E0A|nr:hypothetical protein [Candidatus Mycoplasma haematominutum]